MEIYIYFIPNQETEIDELEDEIEELLDEKGEVTGSGIGSMGANIDIEIYDDEMNRFSINEFLIGLRKLNFPDGTYYVCDGERHNLY